METHEGGKRERGVNAVESTVFISSVILRTPFPPTPGWRLLKLAAAFIHRHKSLIYDDITDKSICF